MLHTLKKKMNYHTRSVDVSAEFELYKGLLRGVRENIQLASRALEEANDAWLKQSQAQRDFSSAFSSGYVPVEADDAVDAAARDLADAAATRHTRFVKETNADTAPYHRMHAAVKEYIREIETLERTYEALAQAKSEADRYQTKVDSIEKSKNVKDEKKSRNLEKSDSSREKFEIACRRTIEAQKDLYAKAPLVSQMVMVAYWRAQAHQSEILNATLGPAHDYAMKHEKDLAVVNVAALDHKLEQIDLAKSLSPSATKSLPSSAATKPSEKKGGFLSFHKSVH